MASSKETFTRNKENVKTALAITRSSTFDGLLVFARAEYFQKFYPTEDQSKAVNDFIAVLVNLPEEEVDVPDVDSGLKHEFSSPRPETKPETKK